MKLSIIIPVYNAEKFLDECISSLFNQGLEEDEFEVILINDGSTDSSLFIVNHWTQKHSNIISVTQENQGQGTARNKGIEMARGKFLMFIDSDDYLLPLKLSKLLICIDNNEVSALIYNLRLERADRTYGTLAISQVEYNRIYSGEEVALKFNVFGSMCKGIFLKDVLKNNNLKFGEGYVHEDSELSFRLYPLIKRVIFVEDEVYFYRYNQESTDRATSIERLRKNIESEAIVVSKIKEIINNDVYSKAIRARYSKIANSMMVAYFLRIRSSQIWHKSEFNTKIFCLKQLGVYPLCNNTCSIKTSLMSVLMNQTNILKLLLFGFKKKKESNI